MNPEYIIATYLIGGFASLLLIVGLHGYENGSMEDFPIEGCCVVSVLWPFVVLGFIVAAPFYAAYKIGKWLGDM